MEKGVNPNIILKIQLLPLSKHTVPPLQRATYLLVNTPYLRYKEQTIREINSVCSYAYTKHIRVLCA